MCTDAVPTPSPTYGLAAPKYDIRLDSCSFAATGSPDIGDITCKFKADGGEDHNINSAIYNADCSSDEAPAGITQDGTGTFQRSETNNGVNQETSTYEVVISLANDAAPEDSDFIDFCLMTNVTDKDGDVYDWIGQKIRLNVYTDGDFSTYSNLTTVEFNGISQDQENAGDANFGVTAYRCDASGTKPDDFRDSVRLEENFFLCVEGQQSGVVIKSIDELKAKQATKDDVNLITGTDQENTNTFVYGKNSNKVVIATRFPATSFETASTITLEGKSTIVTGGVVNGRRLGRSMQEVSAAPGEESADFSMEIGIVADESGGFVIQSSAKVFLGTLAAAALAV